MSQPDDPSVQKPRRGLRASVFVQLTGIATVCALLVAFAMGFVVHSLSRTQAEADLDSHAIDVTPLIARAVANSINDGAQSEASALIDSMVAGAYGPGLAGVVIDAEAAALHQSPAAGAPPAVLEAAREALERNQTIAPDGEHIAAVPLYAPDGSTRIGAVAAAWDSSDLMAQVNANIVYATFAGAAALVVALACAALLIRRRISAPLSRVDAAMTLIAGGDLTVDVPERARGDEIGTIANSLERFRAALAVSEEFNRVGLLKGSAFEGSSAALMITDENLRVLFTNPAVKRLLDAHAEEFRRMADAKAGLRGFTTDDIVGKSVGEMLGESQLIEQIRQGSAAMPLRIVPRFALTSFQVDIDSVQDADGKRIGFVVEWRNIATEQRNASTLEAIDSTFLRAEIAANGTLVMANAGFASAAQTGTAQGAKAGLGQRLFAAAGNGAPEEPLMNVLGTRGGYAGQIRLTREGGGDLLIDATVSPLRGADGSARLFLLLGTDVTEAHSRIAAAEAERRALAEAQQAVVNSLRAALARLSEGDLTAAIDIVFGAEYEQLRADFNEATSRLRAAMSDVSHAVGAIRSETGDISGAADDLSRRTEQQAATLEETAAALDQITSSVKSAADGAAQANRLVSDAKASAESSGQVVREAVRAMHEIEESSGRISKITGVIDEIAFQTNLLALNAGVEAARAGDAGRGFAVVASEVRALAQRSSDAAREIATLISASNDQVKRGVGLVGEAGKALTGIEAAVGEIYNSVSEIAVSAREQSVGLAEINTAVNQLDQVTQQNAAMFEQTSAASQSLLREAGALADSVGRFRVDAGGAEPRAADAPHQPRPVPQAARDPGFRSRRTATRGGAAVAMPAEDVWSEF